MISSARFDADYFARFYEDPRTRILTPDMQRNEVSFVLAFCRYIGIDIKRFADVGAGTGWWAREFSRQYPLCRTVETFDASEAACRLYGHRHVAVQDLGGAPADLVVCRDVLRYVDDSHLPPAIDRLARKCRGVLYLHVVTCEDEFDEEASDLAGFFRPADEYRALLADARLVDCGMGLYVSDRFEDFGYFTMEVR